MAGDIRMASQASADTGQGGSAVSRSAARRRRVLVVDDNEDAAEILGKLLGLFGYQTCTVYDGSSSLVVAQRFQPHCAVLDLNLPGLNGLQLARRLREEAWGREMLLIALTGHGEDTTKGAALASGFDHYLLKPLNINTLLPLLPEADTATQRA